MAFSHLGARSHKAYKASIQWLHMDLGNHWVLYKMDRGHPFEQSHWSSHSKPYSRSHHYKVRDPQKIDQWQSDPIHKQRHERANWAHHIKHGRSTSYYPQGNGQAEATNKVMLKILKKIKHEYGGKWSDHLADVLWACRSSVKTAAGFLPFSLIYGMEAISPVE